MIFARAGMTEDLIKTIEDPESMSRNALHLKDENGRTILHYAAENGHLETVKAICASIKRYFKGDDSNSINVRESIIFFRDNDNKNASDLAKENGYEEVANFIISKGKDPSEKDLAGSKEDLENDTLIAEEMERLVLGAYTASLEETKAHSEPNRG